MLTPGQTQGLEVAFERMAEPITEYLIRDIAHRVAEAGQFTSTAAYEIWRLQELGKSRNEIEKAVAQILDKEISEVQDLFRQAAEVGYDFDISCLSRNAASFEDNTSVQQIVDAAVKLAGKDLRNITQTIGFQTPDGVTAPLLEAYQHATDYAFTQVFTGAADYNTAITRACSKLAAAGIRYIDYQSGISTSLEAAIRRNMMGGLGLMVEQISQKNHDDLGADGWEISAHAASAPDHEPIQGRQYSDEAYKRLNESLRRRIGTLNCGHNAFPIILGVNSPQFTSEELEKFRRDNQKGVDYEGRHFDTVYEATQYQRQIERAVRKQKNRILVDEAAGNEEKLTADQIKLRRLRQEYRRFCQATGLRTEDERLFVSGLWKSSGKKRFTSAAKRDILKDINLDPLPITKESLSRVQKFVCDTLDQPMQAKLQNEHKKLLISISGKPKGTEAGATYSLQMKPLHKVVGQDRAARVHIPKEKEPYIAMHTHPTGGTFTHTDLNLFARDEHMRMLTAVGNNGTVYAVEKLKSFAVKKFDLYRVEVLSRHEHYLESPDKYADYIQDFLKGIDVCGIRYYTAGT